MNEVEKTKPQVQRNGLAFVSPFVDIYENDDEFLLLLDVPGVQPDGVELTFEKNELALEAAGANRRYRRSFVVPSTVDPDKISAAVTAGVLTLKVPKGPAGRPRKIAVTAG